MKILLTEDVVGLGDIGEMVKVKPGYARNFLIPRGLAVESQSASVRQLAHRRREIDAKSRRLKTEADKRAKEISGRPVELSLRVGAGGKVFGSITARDISAALADMGQDIDRRRILLQEPLRKLGDHAVRVKLHADVVGVLTVRIKSVEASKEDEQEAIDEARRQLEEGTAALAAEEEAGWEPDVEGEEEYE